MTSRLSISTNFLRLAAILATVTTLASAVPAQAEEKVSSILYTCNLSFKATGKSIYIGIGYTDVMGSGTITCYDLLTGATQHLPVKVTARGPGAGLGVTGLTISGAATGVGVTAGPENLLGRYGVVRGNAAVGVGASAGLGLRLSKGSVTIDASIEAQSGLGAGVDLLFVDISSDGPVRAEAAKAGTEVPATAEASAAVQAVTTSPRPVPVQAGKVIYLSEGQPLEIVDASGRVLQTIYLKARPGK